MATEQDKSKYQKAVDRARGAEQTTAVTTQQDAAPPAIIGDVSGMLVDGTAWRAELQEKILSGKWEAAPQLLSLRGPDPSKGRMVGDTLVAVLEGNGPEAEFTDEDTGVVSKELTWILSKNGVRVSILGTAQLNKKLPPFVGQMVSITRGADVRNGTRIYTDYLVCGEARPDGTKRDWSTRPMLAATSSASSPPANTNTNGAG